MSARIIVTLILEYAGSDSAEYDSAMTAAGDLVRDVADEVAAGYEAVRVVDVQVTG
jgi:hypothetical protein